MLALFLRLGPTLWGLLPRAQAEYHLETIKDLRGLLKRMEEISSRERNAASPRNQDEDGQGPRRASASVAAEALGAREAAGDEAGQREGGGGNGALGKELVPPSSPRRHSSPLPMS